MEAYDAAGGVSPRLVNLSARNQVGSGADILIAGFALSGSGTKQVLIRAIGPTLTAFGVGRKLADPRPVPYTHLTPPANFPRASLVGPLAFNTKKRTSRTDGTQV